MLNRTAAVPAISVVVLALVAWPLATPAVSLMVLGLGSAAVAALVLIRRFLWLPIAVLLLSLPILGTTIGGGLDVVQVLAVAAVGSTLLVSAWKGPLAGTWVAGVGLLMLLGMLVSSLASARPLLSLRLTIMFGVAVGLVLAVNQLGASTHGVRMVFRAWILAVTYSLAPHLSVPSPEAVELGGGVVRDRLEGIFTQPNYLGELCLLTLFVSIAYLWWSSAWYDTATALVGLGISLIAGGFSLSRGTFIGVGIGMAALALLVPRFRAQLAIWLLALLSLGGVLLAVGNSFAVVLLARLTSLGQAETNPNDAREIIWDQAIKFWAANPLAGIGLGEYRFASSYSGTLLAPKGAWHAHNIVLQIAAEAGAIGLAILVASCLIGAYMCLQSLFVAPDRRYFPRRTNAALFAGLVAVAAHGMVDFIYNQTVLLTLLAVYLGLVALGTRAATGTGPGIR